MAWSMSAVGHTHGPPVRSGRRAGIARCSGVGSVHGYSASIRATFIILSVSTISARIAAANSSGPAGLGGLP